MVFGRGEVPLDRDASGPFLPWIVAVMVYLATLALASAIATNKVVTRWDSGLAGRMTLQIPVVPVEVDPADQATRVARGLELLRAAPFVTEAHALEAEEVARLLEPWLGPSLSDHDLPVPALIAITADPAEASDLAALKRQLDHAVPGAELDDHQRWLGRLLDLARSIEVVAGLVVALVGLAAVITVIFVTRTGLAIHRPVIELLHLIGAQDSYIATQFQWNALRFGSFGGLVGLGLAAATVLAVSALLGRIESGLLPDLTLSAGEWTLLALVPVATATVAMVTARLTVVHALARLP
jgi:cell division transport system permease protein